MHLAAPKQLRALHVAAASLRLLAGPAANAVLRHTLVLRLLATRLAAAEEPLALHVAAATLRRLPSSSANAVLLHARRLLLDANLARTTKQALALHVSAARATRMAMLRLRCAIPSACKIFRRGFQRHGDVLLDARQILVSTVFRELESVCRLVAQGWLLLQANLA